jgi:tetratricopeptide (TPR) repeat protein
MNIINRISIKISIIFIKVCWFYLLAVVAFATQGDVVSNYPVSSRSAALESSDISVCQGIEALYLNPACLSSNWLADIQTTYVNLVNNTHYHMLGIHLPWNEHLGIGLGWGQLISSGFEGRTSNDDYNGTFTHWANALVLGAGWKINPLLRLGGSLKYFNQQFAGVQESGAGADFGMAWESEKWGAGIAVQNLLAAGLSPRLGVRGMASVPQDFVDLNLRIGSHYKETIKPIFSQVTVFTSFEFLKLQGAANVDSQFWNHWNIGIEGKLQHAPLVLRCAANPRHFTSGFAVTMYEFSFEYSLDLRSVQPLHWFSLRWQTSFEEEQRRRRDASLDAAVRAYQAGDYQSARRNAGEVLLMDPEHEQAKLIYWQSRKEAEHSINQLLLQARAYITLQSFESAFSVLNKANAMAIEYDMTPVEIQTIAQIAANEREKELKELIEHRQENAEKAETKQEWIEAQMLWEEILHLDPGNVKAPERLRAIGEFIRRDMTDYFAQGVRAMQNLAYWEAVKFFNAVLKVFPNHTQAIELKNQCRKLLTEDLEKMYSRLHAAVAGYDYEQAREYAARLADIDPNYRNLSEYKSVITQGERRVQSMSKIIEQAKTLAESRRLDEALSLYKVLTKEQAIDNALVDFFSKIQSQAKNAEILKNEGIKAFHDKKFAAGIKALRRSISINLNERTQTMLAQVYVSAGIASYRDDNLASAIDYWEAGEKLDAENPLLQTYLKRARNKLRNIKLLQQNRSLTGGQTRER